MEKTWKPQIAGILSIVGGVIGLFASLGTLITIIVLGTTEQWVGDWGMYWIPFNVISILWAIGIPMFICGVVATTGGIFAVQRKCFPMALAGSIAAFFPAWIFGLASVIFTAISHDEFGTEGRAVVAAEKSN